MSTQTKRKSYTTGVSLEPEVVRCLDEIAVQTGLSRSWVLNTIVLAYIALRAERNLPPLASREGIIRM